MKYTVSTFLSRSKQMSWKTVRKERRKQPVWEDHNFSSSVLHEEKPDDLSCFTDIILETSLVDFI